MLKLPILDVSLKSIVSRLQPHFAGANGLIARGSWIWNIIKMFSCHDDVIKWKHFPRYWPFVRGIHRSPVNSPRKGQWRGALMFSLICAWINGWVNNGETGDLRRHRANCDVTVMIIDPLCGEVDFSWNKSSTLIKMRHILIALSV